MPGYAINWNRRTYTEDEFRAAWAESSSVFEVGRRLGIRATGSGHRSLKETGEALGLSREHMLGGAHLRGKQHIGWNSLPLASVLVKDSTYTNTSKLKKRLWAAGLLEKKCYRCGITEWQGEPAPLALEHQNGDRRDNRLPNLTILCYNCHGLTATFAGRNRGVVDKLAKSAVSKTASKDENLDAGSIPANPTKDTCVEEHCASTTKSVTGRCSQHRKLRHYGPAVNSAAPSGRPPSIEWPSAEELRRRVDASTYREVAESLGVSQRSVLRHIRAGGL